MVARLNGVQKVVSSNLTAPTILLFLRAMDLFHIAIAIEVGADALLSFDTGQIALAQASGLTVIKLAQKPK